MMYGEKCESDKVMHKFVARDIGCSIDYWILTIPLVVDDIFDELKKRIG